MSKRRSLRSCVLRSSSASSVLRSDSESPTPRGPRTRRKTSVLDAVCAEIFCGTSAVSASAVSASAVSDETKTLIASSTRSVVLAVSADPRLTQETFGPIAAMVAGLVRSGTEDETLGFVAYAIASNDEHGAAAKKLASIVATRGHATIASVAALSARTETRTARLLFAELFASSVTNETVVRSAMAHAEHLVPHALDTMYSKQPSAHLVATIAVAGYLDPASKWTRSALERVLAPEGAVRTKAFWHTDVLALVRNAVHGARAVQTARLLALRDGRLTARSDLLPWAAEPGNLHFLRTILDAGVSLQYDDNDPYVYESTRTAVDRACASGNTAALRMLFDADGACFLHHFDGSGLAHKLLLSCPSEFVALAETTRFCLGGTFVDGHHTLAMVAASTGNVEALVYLLSRGSDTRLVTQDTRECLMHLIAKLDAPSIDAVTEAVEAERSEEVEQVEAVEAERSEEVERSEDERSDEPERSDEVERSNARKTTVKTKRRRIPDRVKWGLFRELFKQDSTGLVPLEACSRAQPVCFVDAGGEELVAVPRDRTLSRFMRLCAALDAVPRRRVLLQFGFLAAREADAVSVFETARSLGYSTSEICGARKKDGATDTLGLAASRNDETLFRSLVADLANEGAANEALFRDDALLRVARRSPVSFAALYHDVVVPEARAAIRIIDAATAATTAVLDVVGICPVLGSEITEDAARLRAKMIARRRVHESYIDLSAARTLFPEFARVVARSIESQIYNGETRARFDGIEVFEFLIGIGAHEPHGYTDDTRDARYGYFASVFAPCARHILESLRDTGLVARYVRELCEAVHSTGPTVPRILEHVRIDRAERAVQPEILNAIFDRDDDEDDDDDDDDRIPRDVDYHSIADIRFVGEDASGPGQTREAINTLWAQITNDRDTFALSAGGLVPRPHARARLVGLAGFIAGTAMRVNIPLGLPHLCPSFAAALMGPVDVDATLVEEMVGADGIVRAAKSPSFEMSTEECVSYCAPFDLDCLCGGPAVPTALEIIGPTATHATFGSLCFLVAEAVIDTPAVRAMRRGFHSALCGTYTWGARQIAAMLASSIFEPRDASVLFFGTSAVSVDRIRSKTELVASASGDTYASHESESLALFWHLFRTELTDDQRLRFFTFWTSNASFPVHETPDESYRISPLPAHNAPLFTASTCACHLRVPRYTDKATMLAKMIASLDACGYMGLV